MLHYSGLEEFLQGWMLEEDGVAGYEMEEVNQECNLLLLLWFGAFEALWELLQVLREQVGEALPQLQYI